MRPSPIPRGRSEGEPSVALHHSRMTDGSKPTAHKGSFPILSHRTCAEVAALHHGADVTAPDFICHDGLPRSSTLNRSEMGVIP